jgi:TolB-like protein/Tfp pilus assembly protein PilF
LADIFLSYNREDAATAHRFADAFKRVGLDVWWDTALRSGEAYDEVTEAALRGAKAVVVLWSPRSAVSRWVRAEATVADRNKTLVPVMIEACERPIMFELTQTADMIHWTGALDDPAWLSFLEDVQRFVGREAAPAHALVAPAYPAELPLTKPGARGDAPSLAVLPFANRSGLPEDDVIAIGMVEDLIDALSQGVNVRVLASSSTARFRTGAITDLEEMGRQLGVRYLLEGNVRRTGDSLRVTAQLVKAANGEILWTQKFDQPLSELAALQEDLIVQVAAHLETHVYRIEMARVLKKPADLTAWECVTRAMAAYRNLNAENIFLGMVESKRAVDIAPDYGLAHAMLALANSVIYNLITPDDPEEVERILAQINRALALDPDNAIVLATAAQALSNIGQEQAAVHRAERSLQLSPTNSLAHYACGIACGMLNRTDEAIAHFDAGIAASPGSHYEYISLGFRGNVHMRAGEWDKAEAVFARGFSLNPDSSIANFERAIAMAHNGNLDGARQSMENAQRVEPTASFATWEMRCRRWYHQSPALDEILTHLNSLWVPAECDA